MMFVMYVVCNEIVAIKISCTFHIAVIPARYVLAILGSMGMAIVYGLKVNLSVAMVAMLNHTAIQSFHHSASLGNITASTSHLTLATIMSEDNSACSEKSQTEVPEVRIYTMN